MVAVLHRHTGIYFGGQHRAGLWWLWIPLLGRVPAWEASLSVLGTPVVAIVSSRLILGEDFKLSEMMGILLIGVGLALLSLFGWAASRRGK